MDNLTFGFTMIVVGMGGTLISLWFLSLVIIGLKKSFPKAKSKNLNPEGAAR